MSLGSDFGYPDDGDAVAAQRRRRPRRRRRGLGRQRRRPLRRRRLARQRGQGRSPSPTASRRRQPSSTASTSPSAATAADLRRQPRSVAYDWTHRPRPHRHGRRGLRATDTACAPLPRRHATAVEGKVAFVKWTQADLECGSVARSGNLAAAGAGGFIFANSDETFSAGITGSAVIPGVLVAKTGGDAIRAALAAATAVTVTGTAPGQRGRPRLSRRTTTRLRLHPRAASTAPATSSRTSPPWAPACSPPPSAPATRGSPRAAPRWPPRWSPAWPPWSAGPPDWTPEQVKADIMNTAGQDLFVNGSSTADSASTPPNRVGAGRIQAVAGPGQRGARLRRRTTRARSASPSARSRSPGRPTRHQDRHGREHRRHRRVATTRRTTRSPRCPGVSYAVSPGTVDVAAGRHDRGHGDLHRHRPAALTKTFDADHGDVRGHRPARARPWPTPAGCCC